MLSGIRLANFKAFGASQRVPLRPLTLLFGPNSAGKSSVIHGLALANHAVETGDLDAQRTEIGGEAIDLGGFRQYVHRQQRDSLVELALEIDFSILSKQMQSLLPDTRALAAELEIGRGFRRDQSAVVNKERDRVLDYHGGVRVERFALLVDGVEMLSLSARRDGHLRFDHLDEAHPVFRKVLREDPNFAVMPENLREEDIGGLTQRLNRILAGVRAERTGLFPRIVNDLKADSAEAKADISMDGRGRQDENPTADAKSLLSRILRDLLDGLGKQLDAELRRLLYLGPLRSYPPRHLAFARQHDPNWFAGGGYAWDVARTRKDIRERVNRWLGDAERLKTPYELRIRELVAADALPDELAPKLQAALRRLAVALLEEAENASPPAPGMTGVESGHYSAVSAAALRAVRGGLSGREAEVEGLVGKLVDAEIEATAWTEEVVEAQGDRLQDLVLIDKRSDTPVSHRDVGIGVSQVLPVLVSAYASRERLLAIEQPEIHLHPALQAELGDVFIESALGGAANSFLIETHSEHLLLRIMRRMRQTTSGELPEGLPAVRPEDVMVLFVEPDGPRSLVREMPLNERGDLVKAWPGGFFEEGLREMF